MSTHNPTRRNRNIGTAKQGHGADNRAKVPDRWRDQMFDWRRSHGATIVKRIVHGRAFPFLVEPTRKHAVYACTVDDVARILNALPCEHVNGANDWGGLEGVVFRQQTRKEEQLCSAWGRLTYNARLEADRFGPIVQLTASELPMRWTWGRRQSPDDQEEFARARRFATQVVPTARGWECIYDLDGVRRVQLFHTVLHEVGHWVDYLTKVYLEFDHLEPDCNDWSVLDSLEDRYFQRPSREREAFAHEYADRARAKLEAGVVLPFDRRLDMERLRADGLNASDFCLSSENEP